MFERITKIFFFLSLVFGIPSANAETASTPAPITTATPAVTVKPYRTFLAFQTYSVKQNGEPANPISNVRLEVTFPNGSKVQLPEGGQYWPVGNGQVQEINRIYEIPWKLVSNDGFKFTVQMIRKGSDMLPCQFDISQLSQFNRAYVCRTDTNWQKEQNLSPEKFDEEAIQVRVFTDLNSKPKEIPSNALALRPQ